MIFGFDEANTRVIEELTCREFDCDRMKAEGNLTVLSGNATGAAMLAEIAADFKDSISRGATMLRLLGNIGWGRPNWPDDRAILEFEAHVTGAIADLPAVVVCMYDVQSLPGPTLLMGAFETHPLTIRRNVMRENEHYVPIPAFLRELKKKR